MPAEDALRANSGIGARREHTDALVDNREVQTSILTDPAAILAAANSTRHDQHTMPAPSYIPPKDADFQNWIQNFSDLLTANPTDFGLTAPDATVVDNAYTAWNSAYLTATNPSTRTSASVAAKDAQRASAEATVRPYAQQIARSQAVTPENKVAIGVNLPNYSPVPIPPPLTFPQLSLDSGAPLTHRLRYQDSGLGSGKAKPFGAISAQISRAIGTMPAIDPAQATFYKNVTKAPFSSSFAGPDQGKTCTYFARWVTRSGPAGEAQYGPWSAPLTVVIM